MKPRLIPAIIGSIGIFLLLYTFYAWRFSYFWLDDFNNLFWVQKQTFTQMLWYNINPFTDFFRPFGMLVYWVWWRLFDLNPLPYHLLAWMLHALNVGLLYWLLMRIVGSPYAAAVGALLFEFRANFTEIYWSFGTIFDLLACLLIMVTLLIYSGGLRAPHYVVIAFLYLIAVKSKEMAITLPAILMLYELCFRRHKSDRKLGIFFSALTLLGIFYGYGRFQSMGSDSPANPYYMDFSILTFGRGYGWYFDHLYGLRQRWGMWMIVSVLLLAWFVYKRERRSLFFLGYIFLTLLPVIFLINHRYEFFWYVPFFGIAGLAATVVNACENQLKSRMPAAALAIIGVLVFAVLATAHGIREMRTSSQIREYQRALSEEYAAFVQEVRLLPEPEPEATLLFRSVPRHFVPDVLISAIQVVRHRTDIKAEVVR